MCAPRESVPARVGNDGGGLWPPAVPLWSRHSPGGSCLQTSDCFKEMDDLVTGQSPSTHLFLGGKSEPAARPRPCSWMHVAPRRQSAGALTAWPATAGYWPTDGEEGVVCWVLGEEQRIISIIRRTRYFCSTQTQMLFLLL